MGTAVATEVAGDMRVTRTHRTVTLNGEADELVTGSEIAYSVAPGSRVTRVRRGSIDLECSSEAAPRVAAALANRFQVQ